MSALERWERDLRARAVPERILENAPESPYGFPAELFTRRARASTSREQTPTTTRALEALHEGEGVLDVGVGGGATSLPLAARAGTIIGVDGQQDMLDAFASAALEAGVASQTVLGSWPEVGDRAPRCAVVVCGHVFYNVADLGAFARALHEHATRRVVVELTERHPLAWMSDLWLGFHGIRWPDGPSAIDAAEALAELGFDPHREDRTERGDRGSGGFARREDAVALVRRRLCLPASRDDEVAAALGDRLRRDGDLWSAGPPEQVVSTLWWDV
ncbi:MAG TPA: methyltransferase domain-containing protein [Actinomycetota bacterium]|jgi:precorrin-6B methylase 2